MKMITTQKQRDRIQRNGGARREEATFSGEISSKTLTIPPKKYKTVLI